MQSIRYYRAIHGSMDSASAQETLRREIRKDRREDYAASIGYVPDAKRNGTVQPIVAKTTNAQNKYNIIAMPGDPLAVGDFLEFYGEKWIVIAIESVDVVSLIGVAMQCNYLFRWQSWSPDIICRWGVLDSGVYSTTVRENNQIIWPDKQYKIFLPLDEDTEKIYLDKRIAVGTTYNKEGNKILVVYTVTGRNPVSETYGKGGHLLVLDVRSDSYQPGTDHLDLMLCDYIAPDAPVDRNPLTTLLRCAIHGKDTLKAKLGPNVYTASFYQSDGLSVDPSVTPIWTFHIDPDYSKYIHVTYSGDTCSVSADAGAVGQVFSIELSDRTGSYDPVEIQVKVASVI